MIVNTPAEEGTWPARSLSTLVAALDRWQVDSRKVLAAASLSSADLEDLDLRISAGQHRRVWEAARAATGDDAIGLHCLAAFEPGRVLSPLVYLASSSATAQEAFERVVPFVRFEHEGLDLDRRVHEGRTIFEVGFRDREDERTLSEYYVGLFIKVSPMVTGNSGRVSAWFRHAPPPYAEEYEAALGAEVRFGAPCNAVLGTPGDLDRPLPRADAILCSILERQAAETLARHPVGSTFESLVRRQIERGLDRSDVGIAAIAAGLGISDRTLRRRLSDAGFGYRALLDRVRCARARHLLSQRGASVSEVAFALGFADAPAFHKAFRRWTGQKPSEIIPR